ncbi:MAG: ATP-binding protein, partial [Planctomycetia bacterium]
LDRWREKAKKVDSYDYIGRQSWDGSDIDPGVVLRNKAISGLLADVGNRYRTATLANFVVTDPRQEKALSSVRGYLERLDDHIAAGDGLILYGPVGTGKDHLAIAAGRIAVGMGYSVAWRSAQTIFSNFRDSFSDESWETEADLLNNLLQSDVLILSDPVPSHGELSDFQGNILYRLVNARYVEQKPTWTTLNIANVDEARRRIGSATIDRITHGAMAVFCSWPSFRKPLQ